MNSNIRFTPVGSYQAGTGSVQYGVYEITEEPVPQYYDQHQSWNVPNPGCASTFTGEHNRTFVGKDLRIMSTLTAPFCPAETQSTTHSDPYCPESLPPQPSPANYQPLYHSSTDLQPPTTSPSAVSPPRSPKRRCTGCSLYKDRTQFFRTGVRGTPRYWKTCNVCTERDARSRRRARAKEWSGKSRKGGNVTDTMERQVVSADLMDFEAGRRGIENLRDLDTTILRPGPSNVKTEFELPVVHGTSLSLLDSEDSCDDPTSLLSTNSYSNYESASAFQDISEQDVHMLGKDHVCVIQQPVEEQPHGDWDYKRNSSTQEESDVKLEDLTDHLQLIPIEHQPESEPGYDDEDNEETSSQFEDAMKEALKSQYSETGDDSGSEISYEVKHFSNPETEDSDGEDEPPHPFLAHLFSSIDLPADLLHCPPLTTPLFTPSQHAASLLLDHARSARLSELSHRWRTQYARVARRDFFLEIGLILKNVNELKLQPWEPLATWFDFYAAATQRPKWWQMRHSQLWIMTRDLSEQLRNIAEERMGKSKEKLVELLQQRGLHDWRRN